MYFSRSQSTPRHCRSVSVHHAKHRIGAALFHCAPSLQLTRTPASKLVDSRCCRIHSCLYAARSSDLLVLIFGSFLSAPFLAASLNPQDDLLACCKRNGKHRCLMRMMENDPGSTQVSAPPEKCPLFLHAWSVTRVQNHCIGRGRAIYAELQSHPACHTQSEVQRRISFDRSHQKRGPPAARVAS